MFETHIKFLNDVNIAKYLNEEYILDEDGVVFVLILKLPAVLRRERASKSLVDNY